MSSILSPDRQYVLLSSQSSYHIWVSWCYGSHPLVWHPLGQISLKSGVQQGDPLGPWLFALVLQKLVSSLEADVECFDLLLQVWYLDDGSLAGTRSAVLWAIEEMGPALGLNVNLAKCELFSRKGNTSFPPDVRAHSCPTWTSSVRQSVITCTVLSLLLASVLSPGSCCLGWWKWLQSISKQ